MAYRKKRRKAPKKRRKAPKKRKRKTKQIVLPTTFKELREVDSELAELWDVEETDVWNMFLSTGILR